MQTVIQQATCHTYDGIIIMGYTTQGVHFYHGRTRVRAADYLPVGDYVDYATNDRAAQHYNFHWDDVPADVIAADDALAVQTPTSIGLDSIRTDIIKAEAAQIDVPIFFGHGERDVSPAPNLEPKFFPQCRDFTLFILPRSGHCQAFASTRRIFWDRIHAWSRALVYSQSAHS
jgi:pimeloyl-ACP methyl ester carboxylesterase